MKNFVILSVCVLISNFLFGQNNQLQFNMEPLPENVVTFETPFIFSLQLTNDSNMENYIDQLFFENRKMVIDSMHNAGSISDSLYAIYQKDWSNIEFDETELISNIQLSSIEIQGSSGQWETADISIEPFETEASHENIYTSNLLYFGIDPTGAQILNNAMGIRAILTNGENSNTLNFNYPVSNSDKLLSSEAHLDYLSTYWTFRKEYTVAMQYADKILSINQQSFAGNYQKGLALYNLNQKIDALTYFEIALDLLTEEEIENEPPEELLNYYYDILSEFDLLEKE